MKKFNNLLIVVIFCLFLGGITGMSLLIPDKSFSEMENRNLRQLPEWTLKRFTSGRYMDEAERYASDQLAFRDTWVAVKAMGEVRLRSAVSWEKVGRTSTPDSITTLPWL